MHSSSDASEVQDSMLCKRLKRENPFSHADQQDECYLRQASMLNNLIDYNNCFLPFVQIISSSNLFYSLESDQSMQVTGKRFTVCLTIEVISTGERCCFRSKAITAGEALKMGSMQCWLRVDQVLYSRMCLYSQIDLSFFRFDSFSFLSLSLSLSLSSSSSSPCCFRISSFLYFSRHYLWATAASCWS